MSVSRIKTWGDEELAYADLNAEFNNILNNGTAVAFPLTANGDLGGFALTNGVAGSTAASVPVISSLINNSFIFYTTAGSSTAYTLTPAPAITAYAAGQAFLIKVDETNGATPTINVSALGAKSLFYRDGTALLPGALLANEIILIVYDGTGFRCMAPPGNITEVCEVLSFSASAALAFTFPSGYDQAFFQGFNLIPATNNEAFFGRVMIAGAAQTAGSYYRSYNDSGANAIANSELTTATELPIAGGVASATTGLSGAFQLWIGGWEDASSYKHASWKGTSITSAGGRNAREGWGYWGGAQTALSGMQFRFTGNGTSGKIVARYNRSA